MNPAEGFVLGAAFLIHDAGLTAAAYPGGAEALRATTAYHDLVLLTMRRASPDLEIDSSMIGKPPPEVAERALFDLLRGLHADRAMSLLDQHYVHPITNSQFTLVNPDLLLDFGDLIGKIAASHHWDIKKVDSEFADVTPAVAAYPGWTIDAVKLACILRTADACAIDERRARTMAFIIENPRGVSRLHWFFQKNLRPAHLPEGGDALMFTSKKPFSRDEMDAWWVAFDAIEVAERELRASDRLLKRRARSGNHNNELPLKAKRIEGAGDAEILASHIRADGWRPVNTSARIDDPLAIIETLGGASLYGDDHTAGPVAGVVGIWLA
jgi:hypothetical protein